MLGVETVGEEFITSTLAEDEAEDPLESTTNAVHVKSEPTLVSAAATV
jgi:L-fucose mutarotase/ribose pyranase (RbsD/FucU family)